MRKSGTVARTLWAIALTACGRLGFDADGSEVGAGGPVAQLDSSLVMSATCGAAPEPVTLAITNAGDDELVIDEATATSGFSISTPLPLAIAPGEQAALVVVPPTAVVGTDRGGTMKTGTLSLSTNEAIGSREVALEAMVVGANIGFVNGQGIAVTNVDFASSTGACPAPFALTMTNDGNASVNLVFDGASGNVDGSGFSSGVLSTGAMVAIQVWPVTNSECAGSGFVSFTVTGQACTQTPAVLTASLNITGTSSCMCS